MWTTVKGKRDWCEAAPVDGHGSVDTLAQTWTPLDREVLTAIRKPVLSWAGRVTRMDYSEISAKALRCRTGGQDRIQNDSKSTDGRTLCRPRYPKSVGMQMGLQNLQHIRQVDHNLLRILCNGGSSWKRETMDLNVTVLN